MQAGSSLRYRGFGALAVALCGVLCGCAAGGGVANHEQLTALYVIDHNGADPRNDAALATYSTSFVKILGGCRINPDTLTNETIALAEKSSDVGGRNVTNLAMLRAIARRIAWPASKPEGCGYIFNLAEAHMEAGGP